MTRALVAAGLLLGALAAPGVGDERPPLRLPSGFRAEVFAAFGPDTLAEARNRGYTLAKPGMHRLHRRPRA